jgi:hypothetical protein
MTERIDSVSQSSKLGSFASSFRLDKFEGKGWAKMRKARIIILRKMREYSVN